VVLLAIDPNSKGALSLDAGHDADALARDFEDGALLDVSLEEAAHRETCRTPPQVRLRREHLVQGSGNGHPRFVADVLNILNFPRPGEQGRAHHSGREARALFVHP
jgi:hypothetical protein